MVVRYALGSRSVLPGLSSTLAVQREGDGGVVTALDGPRVLRGPDLGEHHAVGAAVLFVTGPGQGVRRVGRAVRTCGKHTDVVNNR